MDGQIYLDDLGPGVRLTREDGSEFTQPRRTEAWICTEPLCGCTEVRLPIILATPGNAEDPASCELFLDLESRVLAKAETRHLGGSLQGLPERLAAKLVPPDWDRLRNWFIGQKEAQLREADPASLEAEFPAALELDPSLLVSYGVMVPCARPLLFTLGGMIWQARDEYCVCPPCTCEEVLLTFKSWPGEVPWGPAVHEDLGDGPTVRLSLVEPRWESVEAAGAGMPGLEKEPNATDGCGLAHRESALGFQGAGASGQGGPQRTLSLWKWQEIQALLPDSSGAPNSGQPDFLGLPSWRRLTRSAPTSCAWTRRPW
jgi:hypothetical protein